MGSRKRVFTGFLYQGSFKDEVLASTLKGGYKGYLEGCYERVLVGLPSYSYSVT